MQSPEITNIIHQNSSMFVSVYELYNKADIGIKEMFIQLYDYVVFVYSRQPNLGNNLNCSGNNFPPQI